MQVSVSALDRCRNIVRDKPGHGFKRSALIPILLQMKPFDPKVERLSLFGDLEPADSGSHERAVSTTSCAQFGYLHTQRKIHPGPTSKPGKLRVKYQAFPIPLQPQQHPQKTGHPSCLRVRAQRAEQLRPGAREIATPGSTSRFDELDQVNLFKISGFLPLLVKLERAARPQKSRKHQKTP